MTLVVSELIQAVRDRLADTEATPMFDDNELKRHITSAVKDFSRYVPTTKTTTITMLAAPTTNYALPDDCIIILEARDPNDDNALFSNWSQDGNDLVVAEDLIDTITSLTVKYGAAHARTGASGSEQYTTIQSTHDVDVLDLAQAYCLMVLSTDMAKRPTYGDTQVRVDHGDASLLWQRQAAGLRARVADRLNRPSSGIG